MSNLRGEDKTLIIGAPAALDFPPRDWCIGFPGKVLGQGLNTNGKERD